MNSSIHVTTGGMIIVHNCDLDESHITKIIEKMSLPENKITSLVLDHVDLRQDSIGSSLFNQMHHGLLRLEIHCVTGLECTTTLIALADFLKKNKTIKELGIGHSNIDQTKLGWLIHYLPNTGVERLFIDEPSLPVREIIGIFRAGSDAPLSNLELDLCVDYSSSDTRSLERLLKMNLIKRVKLRNHTGDEPIILES